MVDEAGKLPPSDPTQTSAPITSGGKPTQAAAPGFPKNAGTSTTKAETKPSIHDLSRGSGTVDSSPVIILPPEVQQEVLKMTPEVQQELLKMTPDQITKFMASKPDPNNTGIGDVFDWQLKHPTT